MTRALANWLGAVCIALLLSASYLLDGPSDITAMQDVAADKLDAIKTAQVTP